MNSQFMISAHYALRQSLLIRKNPTVFWPTWELMFSLALWTVQQNHVAPVLLLGHCVNITLDPKVKESIVPRRSSKSRGAKIKYLSSTTLQSTHLNLHRPQTFPFDALSATIPIPRFGNTTSKPIFVEPIPVPLYATLNTFGRSRPWKKSE